MYATIDLQEAPVNYRSGWTSAYVSAIFYYSEGVALPKSYLVGWYLLPWLVGLVIFSYEGRLIGWDYRVRGGVRKALFCHSGIGSVTRFFRPRCLC